MTRLASAVRARAVLVSSALLTIASCKGYTPPPLPAALPETEVPLLTLVWVGTGESYAVRHGRRERTPSSDYTFTVTQRRFATHWESVKELHRRNPDYDGSAGPRDQSYLFRLTMNPPAQDSVRFRVQSTLGNGIGASDTLFRGATLEFGARGMSKFAPYNTYRITQHYGYESGELRETVALLMRKTGKPDAVFAEINEAARLYVPGAYALPPTTARGGRGDK
jgi:hypothetical protein